MARRASLRFLGVALVGGTLGCPAQPPPTAAPDLVTTPAAPTATDSPEGVPARPPAAVVPQGLGLLQQPAPMRVGNQAPALYEVGAFPLRTTQLRPGPEDDRQLLEVYCIGCHSTAYIAMQPPLSRSAWEAEVQKMRGAYGAVIPDPAAARIATYLSSYYGNGR